MKPAWVFHRLKKMSLAEIAKRVREQSEIYYSRMIYRRSVEWPYGRFAPDGYALALRPLPGVAVLQDWRHYHIYGVEIDLTGPVQWLFSGADRSCPWPSRHYSTIDYRPGNPYGDVRINWELNRLQFLPTLAIADESLARTILLDWLSKNRYLAGPSYIASMEVALRWLSIYWAVCLFRKPIEDSLQSDLVGLAAVSGEYIEKRLSTHSSAGNHLIVEAVGLFWLGCALENTRLADRWKEKGRKILFEQVPAQLNSDGTNQEQTFWYLGFVLDALFHYLLLEDREVIPNTVLHRIEKATEFVTQMISPDGSFPDYGDRDDGFVSRIDDDYAESPFPALASVGSHLLSRPEWRGETGRSEKALSFWSGGEAPEARNSPTPAPVATEGSPATTVFPDGGMSKLTWGKGTIIFRHSRLGLGNTAGHGHADALSTLFSWNGVPVLIDLGSGQYNGDQAVRSYFRSTIAHNTVEVNGKDQARIVGPFLWESPYDSQLTDHGNTHAEAFHNGYAKEFGIIHTRRLDIVSSKEWTIRDHFSHATGASIRGAFHFGRCTHVNRTGNLIVARFSDFTFSVMVPREFEVDLFFGRKDPLIGWRSVVYGRWEPIHSMVFSKRMEHDLSYKITLKIEASQETIQ